MMRRMRLADAEGGLEMGRAGIAREHTPAVGARRGAAGDSRERSGAVGEVRRVLAVSGVFLGTLRSHSGLGAGPSMARYRRTS